MWLNSEVVISNIRMNGDDRHGSGCAIGVVVKFDGLRWDNVWTYGDGRILV